MKRFTAVLAAGILGSVLASAALAQTPSSGQDPLTLPTKSDPNTVTVPGTLERPAPSPDGDPRTPQQRTRDRRAFDKCVSRVQDRLEDSIGANPVMDSPEDYCSRRMGMKDRNAVPASRYRRG